MIIFSKILNNCYKITNYVYKNKNSTKQKINIYLLQIFRILKVQFEFKMN